eukprot:tig00021244_g19590.t1
MEEVNKLIDTERGVLKPAEEAALREQHPSCKELRGHPVRPYPTGASVDADANITREGDPSDERLADLVRREDLVEDVGSGDEGALRSQPARPYPTEDEGTAGERIESTGAGEETPGPGRTASEGEREWERTPAPEIVVESSDAGAGAAAGPAQAQEAPWGAPPPPRPPRRSPPSGGEREGAPGLSLGARESSTSLASLAPSASPPSNWPRRNRSRGAGRHSRSSSGERSEGFGPATPPSTPWSVSGYPVGYTATTVTPTAGRLRRASEHLSSDSGARPPPNTSPPDIGGDVSDPSEARRRPSPPAPLEHAAPRPLPYAGALGGAGAGRQPAPLKYVPAATAFEPALRRAAGELRPHDEEAVAVTVLAPPGTESVPAGERARRLFFEVRARSSAGAFAAVSRLGRWVPLPEEAPLAAALGGAPAPERPCFEFAVRRRVRDFAALYAEARPPPAAPAPPAPLTPPPPPQLAAAVPHELIPFPASAGADLAGPEAGAVERCRRRLEAFLRRAAARPAARASAPFVAFCTLQAPRPQRRRRSGGALRGGAGQGWSPAPAAVAEGTTSSPCAHPAPLRPARPARPARATPPQAWAPLAGPASVFGGGFVAPSAHGGRPTGAPPRRELWTAADDAATPDAAARAAREHSNWWRAADAYCAGVHDRAHRAARALRRLDRHFAGPRRPAPAWRRPEPRGAGRVGGHWAAFGRSAASSAPSPAPPPKRPLLSLTPRPASPSPPPLHAQARQRAEAEAAAAAAAAAAGRSGAGAGGAAGVAGDAGPASRGGRHGRLPRRPPAPSLPAEGPEPVSAPARPAPLPSSAARRASLRVGVQGGPLGDALDEHEFLLDALRRAERRAAALWGGRRRRRGSSPPSAAASPTSSGRATRGRRRRSAAAAPAPAWRSCWGPAGGGRASGRGHAERARRRSSELQSRVAELEAGVRRRRPSTTPSSSPRGGPWRGRRGGGRAYGRVLEGVARGHLERHEAAEAAWSELLAALDDAAAKLRPAAAPAAREAARLGGHDQGEGEGEEIRVEGAGALRGDAGAGVCIAAPEE